MGEFDGDHDEDQSRGAPSGDPHAFVTDDELQWSPPRIHRVPRVAQPKMQAPPSDIPAHSCVPPTALSMASFNQMEMRGGGGAATMPSMHRIRGHMSGLEGP